MALTSTADKRRRCFHTEKPSVAGCTCLQTALSRGSGCCAVGLCQRHGLEEESLPLKFCEGKSFRDSWIFPRSCFFPGVMKSWFGSRLSPGDQPCKYQSTFRLWDVNII